MSDSDDFKKFQGQSRIHRQGQSNNPEIVAYALAGTDATTPTERALRDQLMQAQQRISDLAVERFQLRLELDQAQTATPAFAHEPDWDAVKDRTIGDLSPAEHSDAYELWLRNQCGFFRDQTELEFLFKRLDQARGKIDLAIAPSDTQSDSTGKQAEQDIIPGEPNSVDWCQASYEKLKIEIIDAGIQAGLATHSNHPNNMDTPHAGILKMAHDLGEMVRLPGFEQQNPVQPYSDDTYTRINAEAFDFVAKRKHEDLCVAMIRAGKTMGLIATEKAGQPLHDQMTGFAKRIKASVATQQQIAGEMPEKLYELHKHGQTMEQSVKDAFESELPDLDDDDQDHAPSMRN